MTAARLLTMSASLSLIALSASAEEAARIAVMSAFPPEWVSLQQDLQGARKPEFSLA